MIKNIVYACTLLFLINLNAQSYFFGPSAIAHNPLNNRYYVVNNRSGNVVSLNTTGNPDTFTTGLSSPTNILFATFPAIGSGFLVLDSIGAKLFDTSGTLIYTEIISGSQLIQDAVFDSISQAVYISDLKRGAIYKTTFGAAPFYIPTTAIFVSGLTKPSGLYLDKSNNRLLYVEMANNSKIQQVNLTTKAVTLLKTIGLDSVLAIDKDLQGNYYLASKKQQGIYFWNKNLTGSPVKIYFEPNPADFIIDTKNDIWAYCCYSCNKVYFTRLHKFGPMGESNACAGSSFYSNKNPWVSSIGTFSANNTFIVELSNSKYEFGKNKSVIIGSKTDSVVSDSIFCTIPTNIKGGFYRLRWRSTNPPVIGFMDQFYVNALPNVNAFILDSAQLCLNATLQLGNANGKQYAYNWYPTNLVSSTTSANPNFIGVNNSKVYVTATDTSTGCVKKDSVYITILAKPNVGNFADTVKGCKGTPILIGFNNLQFSYSWLPANAVDSANNKSPKYVLNTQTKMLCNISLGSCSTQVSQVFVPQLVPVLSGMDSVSYFCPLVLDSTKFILKADNILLPNANYTLNWINNLGDSMPVTTHIYSSQPTKFKVIVKSKLSQCTNMVNWKIFKHNEFVLGITKPLKDSLLANVFNVPNYQVKWYKNNTLMPLLLGKAIHVKDTGTYYFTYKSKDSCLFVSEKVKISFLYANLKKVKNQQNKTNYWVTINSNTLILNGTNTNGAFVKVSLANGQILHKAQWISSFPYALPIGNLSGLFIVSLYNNKNEIVQTIKLLNN